MKVCLVTYDSPHLKTHQVLHNLLRKEQQHEIGILLAPFESRPQRAVRMQHRPDQFVGPHIATVARRHRLAVKVLSEWRQAVDQYELFLICGAGLLPGDFAAATRTLNTHPGLLPLSRGLDAFKWAILNGYPLGVSLHYIDEKVDAGELVATVPTEVYSDDTPESLAQRHYEAEIDVLSNFERYLAADMVQAYPEQPPKMRMPIAVEERMLAGFGDYLVQFARA